MIARIASTATTYNLRILVVDDEEMLLELIREVLEEVGYEVTALANSEAAFYRFAASPLEFDLVVADEKMPGLSGTDLSEKILSMRPGIPVILYTDYPDAASVKRARTGGVRAIIGKSYDMKQLIVQIRRIFEN